MSDPIIVKGKVTKPPVFDMAKTSFQSYLYDLTVWSQDPKLEDSMKGREVFLSLPDEGSNIKELIRTQIGLEDMCKPDTFDKIVKIMRDHLGGDDLGNVWKKFDEYDSLIRSENMSVEDFIVKSELKYNALVLQDKDSAFSSYVRGMLLLKRANLDKEIQRLCLSGVDCSNKVTFYEQMKIAIKKFAGNSYGCTGSSGGDYFSPQVKQEAMAAEQADVYIQSRSFGGKSSKWRNWRPNTHAQKQPRAFQYGGAQSRTSGPAKFEDFHQNSSNFNPPGRDGFPKRCLKCKSIMHLLNNCPHLEKNANLADFEDISSDEEVFQLFTGQSLFYINELRVECEHSGVLDSACSKTVCSRKWIDKYIENLSDFDKQSVVFRESENRFKFGAGDALQSEGVYRIPIYISNRRVLLETDVVASHIPLLISLPSMKKLGVSINTVSDEAIILGKKVNLNTTSSGHYSIDLTPEKAYVVEEVFKVDLGATKEEQERKILHLHRQFGHICNSKLIELLRQANSWRPEFNNILDRISRDCVTCKLYRREKPTPVVGAPKSQTFNQVLTIDLKKYDDNYIIYFIDDFSRLVLAKFIPNKKPETVINAFMTTWLAAGYGKPDSFYWDNGGEFNNEQMYEVASKLGVKVMTTAASCPFSNGTCERNHAVVDNIVDKLREDNPNQNLNEIIAWACMIKNSMCMFNGFSPYQIVYGRNPSLPGDDDTMDIPNINVPQGEVFRKHLNYIHKARKAFVEGMTGEKVRRALSHKVRTTEHPLFPDDQVFYKKADNGHWFGPAKVVSQQGKVVFLLHGSYLQRVSRNRVVLKNNEFIRRQQNIVPNDTPDQPQVEHEHMGTTETHTDHTPPIGDESSDSEEEGLIWLRSRNPENINNENDLEEAMSRPSGNDEAAAEPACLRPSIVKNKNGLPQPRPKLKPYDVIKYRKSPDTPWKKAIVHSRGGKVKGINKNWYNLDTGANVIPMDMSKIEFKKLEGENRNCFSDKIDDFPNLNVLFNNEEVSVPTEENQIQSGGFDSSDDYESCSEAEESVNVATESEAKESEAIDPDPSAGVLLVENDDELNYDSNIVHDVFCVDSMKHIFVDRSLRNAEYDSFVSKVSKSDITMQNIPEKDKIVKAQQEEIDKLMNYESFESVPDHGQTTIGSRWVYTNKSDGTMKARLVAKGFQETSEIQSDSPTIGRSAFRLFLTVVPIFGWNIFALDIRSAFLQGREIQRDIFIKPPKGFEKEGTLWKLKKCLYGLKDGSRNFYFSVKEDLIGLGCVVSDLEPTLYMYYEKGKLEGILISHVDDFAGGGSDTFHKNVVQPIMKKYHVSKFEKNVFKYIGMFVEGSDTQILLSMEEYINKKIPCERLSGLKGTRDLTNQEYTLFRGMVGRFNWLAGACRPDLSFKVVDLSTKFQQATVADLKQAYKVIDYVKDYDFKLCFPKLDKDTLSLVLFTDASLGNLPGSNSCGGFILFMVDKNSKCSPLAWHSGKLKRVATSTLAAETLALEKGLDTALYVNDLVKLVLGRKLEVLAMVDSKSLVQAIASTSLVEEKRLRRNIALIKETITHENVVVKWVPTKAQLADVLTKLGVNPGNMCKTLSRGQFWDNSV